MHCVVRHPDNTFSVRECNVVDNKCVPSPPLAKGEALNGMTRTEQEAQSIKAKLDKAMEPARR